MAHNNPTQPAVEADWPSAIAVSVRTLILFITVLSLPLTASEALKLSSGQTTSWILFFYCISGLASLVIAFYYRQPIIFTGNIFALIFIVSLGGEFNFSELMGAFIVTGAFVLLVSVLGITERLALLIPAPVIFGLLAGAIMPFVSNIFTALGDAPLIVGLTLVAYFLSGRFFGSRVPAIFPALVFGLAAIFLTGQNGTPTASFNLFDLSFTRPEFSLTAILTITPILLVLIILQSNLPSIVFLDSQGYRPPGRVIDLTSSIGTILGSFIGPMALSISLPVTSLVAGQEAGPFQYRQLAVCIAAIGAILIGLLAGIAAFLPVILPAAFITTMAGLALVGVLSSALKKVAEGPLRLGPMFAFAIALSDISLLGFGPFFWALIIGTAVSLLLERNALREINSSEQARKE
jgi:benzoate membrane transport protein